jgi:DNA-binding transcriptional LysR family regulator
MSSGPAWGDFEILLALSRGGSVAGAARELGVDGSTVSRRLTAIEESLGARLIVRGGREFGWTIEGRAALVAAEAMAIAVNGAVAACREARLETAGAVRISLPPAFVPMVVAKMLPALREKEPSLKVEVSGDFRKVDLAKGEADIALRMVRPSEPSLVARRLFDVGWCLYTSVAYAGTRGTPKTVAELKQHHLVLYDESLHAIEPLQWLESHRGSEFLRVDTLEVVAQVVAAGSGIALLPAFFEGFTPGLVRVFGEPVTSNTGWIVYHESARERARVRAVVEALAEFCEANSPLFSGLR